MSLTTTSGASILTPEQVDELVIKPLANESVAMRISRVVPIVANSLRVPVLSADPAAAWTAEGAEIAVTDPTLVEVDIVAEKLAGLVVISNELAADSSPAALQVVGDGLVRDLARKIDAAYFGNTVANGPSGLLSIISTAVDAGDAWGDFDWAEQAKAVAEAHNTVVDSFVCSPATAVTLSTLKVFSTVGSNQPLLQADPSAPAGRVISGVPLITSPSIADNIVWAVPRSRVIIALRAGSQVTTDSSAFYTSDRTAVRAIVRLGIGFTDPAAIAKIAPTP